MSTPRESRDRDRPAGPVTAPSCEMADADEPMGGDPPCWAHLFEDDEVAEAR
jgi:hypothetical protein